MAKAAVPPKRCENSPLFTAFTENESILKGFLRRFVSSPQEVEDITQETILRALQAEGEAREPRAFLFGIARNIIRKELDRKSRSVIDFIDECTIRNMCSGEPTVDEVVDQKQSMRLFLEALSALPSQCQRVFVLKKVYGYSHREISDELGISISTTEKHVAAGLQRCSEYLERRATQADSLHRRGLVANREPSA